MRLGFLILSAKSPDSSFIDLLEFLHGFDEKEIFIHHDYSQSKFPDELIGKYNLKLAKRSHKTYWSHLNNVLAMIDVLTEMYTCQPQIDWFITLTPNCYPIKTREAICLFFENTTSDVYMDMHRVADRINTKIDDYLLRDIQMQPWLKVPIISRNGKFKSKIIRKKIPLEENPFLNGTFEYYQGSNYFYINRNAVQDIVSEKSAINLLISFYTRYIKSMPDMHPCPQETIIQTFIANQKALKIQFNNYRYIDWENAIDWSPNWLKIQHFNKILESGAHWIRKVRYPDSKELIDKIKGSLI